MIRKLRLGAPVVLAVVCALAYFQPRSFDWDRFGRASHVDLLHIMAAIGCHWAGLHDQPAAFIPLEHFPTAHPPDADTPFDLADVRGIHRIALLGRPGEFIRPYLLRRNMSRFHHSWVSGQWNASLVSAHSRC